MVPNNRSEVAITESSRSGIIPFEEKVERSGTG